ncbi:Rne/Rng family ribonuclease [Pseudofrankia sp. DC12]|uniref:Rne/Rng family ribonuclease n=1 Tax=Pseudofrankia sp. DC12 TaxID=683315 RepID=UPI000696E77A|nr:Rne/Rng family ribonuclease [Pseudofrankia sp. DC12]
MPDDILTPGDDNQTAAAAEESAATPRRRRAAGRPAGPPAQLSPDVAIMAVPAVTDEADEDQAVASAAPDPASTEITATEITSSQDGSDETSPAEDAIGEDELDQPAEPAETGADQPAAVAPAASAPAAEPERRPRARRAVRAVLTPVVPLEPAEATAVPVDGADLPAAPQPGATDVASEPAEPAAPPARRRARAARRGSSAPPETPETPAASEPQDTAETATSDGVPTETTAEAAAAPADVESAPPAEAEPSAAPRTRRRRARAAEPVPVAEPAEADEDAGSAEPAAQADEPAAEPAAAASIRRSRSAAPQWSAQAQPFLTGFDAEPAVPRVTRRPITAVTFQAPDLAAREPAAPRGRDREAERRPGRPAREAEAEETEEPTSAAPVEEETADVEETEAAAGADASLDDADLAGTRRRRRGRRGRGRARGEDELDGAETADTPEAASADTDEAEQADEEGDEQLALDAEDEDEEEDDRAGSRRRRRRRRRATTGEDATGAPDDPPNTVVHVRETRRDDDLVRGVSGSTRLEAKRQRRREGRDSGRRRPPIVTEAEFLARRESVERRMLVRHAGDRTQIAVLEDGVLVEHFVTRASSASYAGNVYLGRVQNVLASMEAAFVDIGKGRNAVLYAGEVNYDASGLEGRPRKIEQVLKPGQSVLVQVSKDPIGHKGARLTSQISLPGRYLVYVPDGQNAGISRKLPDVERARLKSILKKITPEDGGVIVRTAAEGASEQELERDIERLAAQWEDISRKAQKASAPALLYGEPDLVVRVIRDIFNEDFTELLVQGSGEAETIEGYVDLVAPDLRDRVRRHVGTTDLFTEYRVDEQLAKALDRKVWLPSGGSLVIDRTEAMTVVDVNTGKFTGKGGNLEETVTKNNLEAAEEIVRQLRLRDIGGIIVIDFIDMVLESNRELVLRRLTECLGRDRTRHQVAEVTSLGLVQMTRKRVGQGLLEAYSEPCAHCNGRGVLIHLDGHHAQPPVPPIPAPPPRRAGRRGSALASTAELDEPVVGEPDGLDERPASDDESTGDRDGGRATTETGEAGTAREGRRTRRARRAASAVIAVPEISSVDVTGPDGALAPAGQAAAPDAHATGWPGGLAGAGQLGARAGEPGGVGWPVGNGSAADSHHNGAGNGASAEEAGPTVFANSADPDSAAVGSEPGGGRGRRPRRASRPAAKPAESVEASASAE